MRLTVFADTNTPEVILEEVGLTLANGNQITVSLADARISHVYHCYLADCMDVDFLGADARFYAVGNPSDLAGAKINSIHVSGTRDSAFFFGIMECAFENDYDWTELESGGKYLYQVGEERFLTYEDLISLGKKHYNHGGDVVVECWDQKTFDTYVANFGSLSETMALAMFQYSHEHDLEMEGMKDW